MKRITIFLTLMLILCSIVAFTQLLKASPSGNDLGTAEWEDPPEHLRGDSPNYTVYRNAGDNDVKVWSYADTSASQAVLGHSVSASVSANSVRSGFLHGKYTVNTTLYQDWVDSDNTWDGGSGQWFTYLQQGYASTSDMDWFDSYVPRETIQKCFADGYATAKDVRHRSANWKTFSYIPW